MMPLSTAQFQALEFGNNGTWTELVICFSEERRRLSRLDHCFSTSERAPRIWSLAEGMVGISSCPWLRRPTMLGS